MALREAYLALIGAPGMQRDPAQLAVVDRLQTLLDALKERSLARKGSALGWLFGGGTPKPSPRGLYIHGPVGRGKTMLMDLFFDHAPATIRKQRVHFHGFMADTHDRIFRYRTDLKAGRVRGEDPIPPVAAAIAEEASLLCFDEFSVTDIADAMLLGRLFTQLFARGVVVVATSNVEPDSLYAGGLNRALFLPFIALLHEHMDVLSLASPTDYRLTKLSGVETYVVRDPDDASGLGALFERLTGGVAGTPIALPVKGRTVAVPAAAMGVAWFHFDDLCRKPLGASDYLAIAERFHTVLIAGVPVMDEAERNEAKRFITLVDTLYDRGVKLLVEAAAEPGGLYRGTDGSVAFEFQRTVSRLTEMRSVDYLARRHGRGVAGSAIVET
ncbi:MAG: cell division protein ZapE [Labrys sp. (in: a-proteobacteria)]